MTDLKLLSVYSLYLLIFTKLDQTLVFDAIVYFIAARFCGGRISWSHLCPEKLALVTSPTFSVVVTICEAIFWLIFMKLRKFVVKTILRDGFRSDFRYLTSFFQGTAMKS